MTIEELDRLTTKFKSTFPYYDKNPDIVIDDTTIEEALIKAEMHISEKCKTFRDEILVYLAMHIILKDLQDEEAFINGEFEQLDKVDSYQVGDIDVKLDNKTNGDSIPAWWGSTKYGIRAWELSRLCAKSRVGLIA